MAITSLSSREFNQDTSRAKKAAKDGPVFITDRGRPAHVLQKNLAESLAMPNADLIHFDPPRVGDEFPVAPDLS